MRVFIDDSGDFGWVPAQISLHCGVIVCSSSLVDLFRRHYEWKRSIIGPHRRREIKASALADDELETFVKAVIVPESKLKLTVVGIDTSVFAKELLEKWRDSISHWCRGAARWSNSQNYPIAERQYTEMSGWLWNRSPENLAVMLSLSGMISQSLQYSIIWFHEPKFESEFEDLEIVIDRSFIKSREHELFWGEFLRTYLTNTSRREPLGVPEKWKQMNHVFERKHCQSDGQVDLTPLFREHMYFSDSQLSEGLQIADICAHICLRYYRRKACFAAYGLLRKFIVGPDGSRMTALLPSGETDPNSKGFTKTQQEVFDYTKQTKLRSRKC